jgi:hypothetical protein
MKSSCAQISKIGSTEMKYWKTIFASIGISVMCNLNVAAQEPDAPGVDMKKKLEYSKNILDGLVMEDFETILQSAKSLNQLGQRKWLENESSEYRAQNQVFWFTAANLVLAAEKKNIDAATLAYSQMTVSCVNCHKLIRTQ